MDVFTALAEPHRRSIIEMLASKGRLSASAIAREFQVSPPAVSQHLKVLREARLVRMQKRAQQRLYELNPEAMRDLEHWAQRMAQEYERQFDRLERLVNEEEQKDRTLRGRKEEQNGNGNQAGEHSHGRQDQDGR